MSVTEELVSNMLETRLEDIPEEVVKRAKDEIIDIVGCAVGAANAPGCPEMVDLLRERDGEAESTILAYGVRVPASNAALANAAMSRVTDYGAVEIDVDGEPKRAHIGEMLVPVALAVAEQRAASGREMLMAVILGEDIVSRLMISGTPRFDRTAPENLIHKLVGGASLAHVFGASAIVARLSGFSEGQLINAFRVALDEAVGSARRIYDGSSNFEFDKKLARQLGISSAFGLASQFGILAAGLAAKNSEKAEDPLAGEGGYFSFCQDYNPKLLTRDLGKEFYTEVVFKPYPVCRGNHSGIDCALGIVRKHKINVEDIEKVTMIVSPSSRDFITAIPFTVEGPPHYTANLNAHQSLQYNVANILLRKSVKLEHFFGEFVTDPRIAELVKKMKITSEGWPIVPGETFSQATSIKVLMKDGREFSEYVKIARGHDTLSPLTREEKREKFMDNARFSRKITAKNAEKALNTLEKLEEADDIKKIVDLLVP